MDGGWDSIKYLTREETVRFFGAITDPRDRALFATIYHYGLRVSEATLLELADVDLERGRIRVRRVKNGIGGERPLLASTARCLREYLAVRKPAAGRPRPTALFTGRQGGLGRQRIEQLFRRYAEEARLGAEFSVHCLRHSIATHLLEAGLDIEYVRDHLGHVNIQNTAIYARITDRRRDLVFRKLEESPEIVKPLHPRGRES